jgi:hypothetical protein
MLEKAEKNVDYSFMSLAEMKAEVKNLTPAEREELAAHIEMTQREDNPEWLEELERRRDRTEAGHFHTEADLLRRHEELVRQGR